MQSDIAQPPLGLDDARLTTGKALVIVEGRALVFSPPWADEYASVLFDRNSGDYWLLSPLTREIVQHLNDTGPQDARTVIRHVTEEKCFLEDCDRSATTIRRVIDELVQLSILAHT